MKRHCGPSSCLARRRSIPTGEKGSVYEMAHDDAALPVSGPGQVILEAPDPPRRLGLGDLAHDHP